LIGDALLATPLYGNNYGTATARDIYLTAGEWIDLETGNLYHGEQTLRDFALPPYKTPLFVCGSGITLENHDGKVVVCVYPMAAHAAVSLMLPEGGNLCKSNSADRRRALRGKMLQSMMMADIW
jgi:hypothetical protein